MQERLIEIIVYLLREFHQEQSPNNYQDLSKELMSRGYTENEINLAFSWIFNHLQRGSTEIPEDFHYQPSSNRVLHDLEKMVISAEAYGYILQLHHLGIISDIDLELLIEKSLALGTPTVTLDEIKSLAASIIFNSENGYSSEGFFYYPASNTIH